jgi:hypothetical protein
LELESETKRQREREINSTGGECVGILIFDEEEGSGFRNRIQELE